jgi:uroporphyrinogen-III synthase
MSSGLDNRTILVTRQREQSVEFIAEVERRGGRVVLLPMITIEDPDSWEECDRALQQIKSYDILVFTSVNGVERFFQRCLVRGVEHVTLRRCAVYAVGEKTKEAIENRGFPVMSVPDKYSSDSLKEHLKSANVRGKRVLYPRGNLGKGELVRGLMQQGATVDQVVVYANRGPDEVESEHVYEQLVAGDIDVITFASPSAARSFLTIFSMEKLSQAHVRVRIAVIGPTTEQAVRALGLRVDIVSSKATVEGLVDAIEQYYAS